MKRLASHTQQTLFKLLLHLQPAPRSEGGYIIVVVAGMIVAISAMLLSAELLGRVDSHSTKASGNSSAGFYAAEAGLNLRAKEIRAKFEGYNVPSGTSPTDTSCRGASSTKGTDDFACNNSLKIQDYLYPNDSTKQISVSTYVIDATRKDSSGNLDPETINIGPGELFGGLSAQEYRYDVASTAFDRANQPTAFLGIRFKNRLVPLFQFAAFYENDLDFYRPAPMTINGPIHTNGNLYLNAGEDLTLKGQLTSHGRMYRGPKNPSETCNANSNGFSGTVKIKYRTSSTLLSMDCNGPLGEITQETSNPNRIFVGGTFSNDWGGQIRPRISRLTIPPSSFIDAKLPEASPSTQKYDYWNKADLRIALRLNSDESPVSIEVVNPNQSIDTTATNTLNSSTCLPTSTTTNLAGSSYATSSTSLTVANSSIFNDGNPLRIVGSSFEDSDENVIVNRPSSTILNLRRPLGKQAISSVSGVTVQKAIVWSSKTFFNYREKELDTSTTVRAEKGRLIRMLNVDVQGLMNCASSLMGKSLLDETEGGLVWHFTIIGPNSEVDVTKTTPDSPNSYGIRLYNGANLGSIKGLTIASDQAIYIRGDYNSINKKPAAILADSINVLSNSSQLDDSYTCTSYDANYNASDCTTTTPVSSRPTSNTTINAAFLAGVDVTGSVGGEDSGGLNNYPRLHEYWPGSTFTYRGSMVSLGKARRVNGLFGVVGSDWNIYNAPNRNWDYDTDFNNAANLPPLSPRFVYLRQERFSRDYTRTSSLPLSSLFASFFPANLFATLPTAIGGRFLF